MATDTAKYIRDFMVREEAQLKLAKEKGLKLPERLANWRTWIGDTQLYLNELRNFVEVSKPRAKDDSRLPAVEPAGTAR